MTGNSGNGARPPENGWLPDTPVEDNLLRRFLHNQADLYDEIAAGFDGTTARTPEVALAASRCVVPYFNEALLLRPLLDARDPVLDEIDAFFAASDSPAWVLLSPWPTPPLLARGWQLGGHPAFVVRTPGAPLRPAADRPGVELSVRRATTAADVVAAEQVHERLLPTGLRAPRVRQRDALHHVAANRAIALRLPCTAEPGTAM